MPALDVPVPQMVDQLPDIEQFFRALSPDPEQVIEVPKFLPLDVPMRAALRVTQLVEQLVEVPTIISYSSLLRTVEQIVDIPVPVGGGRLAGLQGFLPGQSSTAPTVVQIVDIPRGGLQGSRTRQGSPASSSFQSPAGSDDDADEPGGGVLAKLASHSGSELLPESRLLSWRTPSSGCSSGNASLARPTSGTDVLTVQSGRHHLVSRSCGSAKGIRREGFGTGTGIRVSVRIPSLLFLLGEELYRQPRAVYKYWAGGLRSCYHAATSSSSSSCSTFL